MLSTPSTKQERGAPPFFLLATQHHTFLPLKYQPLFGSAGKESGPDWRQAFCSLPGHRPMTFSSKNHQDYKGSDLWLFLS